MSDKSGSTPLSLEANPHLMIPDWHAPAQVKALVTLRTGGVSAAPFASFNLGDHVGDEPQAVAANRARLAQWAGLRPEKLQWLRQVHGINVADVQHAGITQEADAVTTTAQAVGCIVMTADCLPVFFCDRQGRRVAVAHAGWRGLAAGVLQATLAHFDRPDEVMVWLGPAIGPQQFEVGEDVRRAFIESDRCHAAAFQPHPVRQNFWLADLYALARQVLMRDGVMDIGGGNACTFAQSEQFFSYRRDGQTGRMASLIWLQPS